MNIITYSYISTYTANLDTIHFHSLNRLQIITFDIYLEAVAKIQAYESYKRGCSLLIYFCLRMISVLLTDWSIIK